MDCFLPYVLHLPQISSHVSCLPTLQYLINANTPLATTMRVRVTNVTQFKDAKIVKFF